LTQPTVTVSLGQLTGWELGTSLLGTDTYLATYVYMPITSRVMDFSIRRGRQHELDRIETGTATVTLINQDGAVTPTNTSSVYYPDIRPMVPIKIQATFFSSPIDIAGLVAWFSFDDVSTLWKDTARTSPVTADGDIIKGVTDKSGNGHHLSEATNGPTYKVAIQNGLSIARFDGTNDELSVTGLTAPSAWTWFGVFIKRGAIVGAPADTVVSLDGAGFIQLYTDSGTHATGMNYYRNQAASPTANVATSPLSWGIKVMRANSISSVDIYTAGGTPVNLDPDDTVLTGQTVIGLAHDQGSNTNYGDYDIAEMVLYNSALAATDMNNLGAMFAAKWGVTWTTV
jgi:hypothetical protein